MLTRADASAALADLEAAQARSATLRGYQSAAPHLIIWGVVWAIGYVATDLAPASVNLVWPLVAIAGSIASASAARADRPDGRSGGKMALLILIFFVFIGSVLAVMQPADPRQVGAFIPLVVAAAYAIVGLLGMPRLLVLGAGMAVLTLGGFFALPAHFALWMAVVGGGSLALGGLWLRRV